LLLGAIFDVTNPRKVCREASRGCLPEGRRFGAGWTVGGIAERALRASRTGQTSPGTGSAKELGFGRGRGWGRASGGRGAALKRRRHAARLRPPAGAAHAGLRPERRGGTREGMSVAHRPAAACRERARRHGASRLRPGSHRRPGTVGPERYTEDLGGEQSPWEERASSRRQRQDDGNGLVGGARP
jgi:hypothetical protein